MSETFKNLEFPVDVHEKKIRLIEASAGTGKTYSISNLYLQYILEGQKVEEILVVTFTKAATKELKDRLRANLAKAFSGDVDETMQDILSYYEDKNCDVKALLERAILNFDQSAIFTIHGFCQRMLKENAFESGALFDEELISSDKELIEEVVNDFWREENYPEGKNLNLSRGELLSLLSGYNGQKIVVAHELNLNERQAVLDRFKELFDESSDAIYADLEATKLLSQSKAKPYYKDLLPKYFSDLKQVAHGEFSSEYLKTLKLFCQSSIDAGKLKKASEDDLQYELFQVAEALYQYFTASTAKKYFIDTALEKLKAVKARLNVISQDDLIKNLHEVIELEAGDGPLHKRIRKKYKVALVDEFQDTDTKQYEIFNSLFGRKSGEHSFYMIGDPKQSIYAFRGADIFSYLQAKEDAHEKLTLNKNYRSETGMVQAVNKFFSSKGKEESFAFPSNDGQVGISFEEVDVQGKEKLLKIDGEPAALQLRWWEREDGQPLAKTNAMDFFTQNVCSEIVRLLNMSQDGKAYFEKDGDREKVKPGDFAILTNNHKQARSLLRSLNKKNIPAVIAKSGNVFDSKEAKDLLRFLNAVIEPKDSFITPLLLSSFFTFTGDDLRQRTEKENLDFLSELMDYQKDWSRKGFLRSIQSFMLRHRVKEEILRRSGGERSLSNFMQVLELLHEVEQEEGFGLTSLSRFLSEKIHSDDKDDERYEQRLETDAEAVQIMTIHKSKGLEFPIVFVPYTWSQTYKEYSAKSDFSFYQ